MKRVFFLTFAVLMMFAIVSCKEDEPEGKTEANPALPQPPKNEIEALFDTDNGFPANMSNAFKIYGHKNPLFTQAFGADPNVIIYNDRLYVYMSNDTIEYTSSGEMLTRENDPNKNSDGTGVGPSYGKGIQGLRMISSADLANWTDHGPINITGPANTNSLISNDEWNRRRLINNPSIDRSWAPTAAWKNIGGKDKFFLYWPNGGNGVGVVVADTPIGPWFAPFQNLIIDRNTPNCSSVLWLFDPGVFVDEDGSAYIYFGGGYEAGVTADNTTHARRVKLGADMISIDGVPEQWYVPYLFEASDMKKIKGRYYFSYSTNYATSGNRFGFGNYDIAYMMTDTNPMAPGPALQGGPAAPAGAFSEPKSVLKRADTQLGSTDSNNHHAMFEFKDETYIIYHTQKAAEAMGTYPTASSRRLRTAAIDKMPINADGTIPPVTMTRKGIEQVGHLDPYILNEAETIGVQGGIYVRPLALNSSTNRNVVTSIDTGDWIVVYGVDFGSAGAKKFSARVRTSDKPGYKGAIQLRLDPTAAGVTSDTGNLTPQNTTRITGGRVIGHLMVEAIPGTEGQFATITIDLDETVTGVHDLVFVFYASTGVHPETIAPDSRHKNGFEFDQWQFFK